MEQSRKGATNRAHAEDETLTMTACRKVRVLLPTEVPKALATSLAPACTKILTARFRIYASASGD